MSDSLHDNTPPMVSLDNLNRGAVYEMFDDAIKAVARNVADVNTEPTAARKVLIEITVKPYKDRTGAEVTTKVNTKLAGIRPAEGALYFARKDGDFFAFTKDARQEEMNFDLTNPVNALESGNKPQ